MPKRNAALRFIFITLMLDVLGFGLLIPVAPRLVESMLHGGAGGTESEAAPIVAALQSTFYAMAFLCAPALGVLSDRVGRRPVILISLFGSGLDYFAMALAPTIPWFFVTRVINGMTGASFAVGTAYIADVTPPEKRAGAYGLIGAAFGIGFVLGPVLGGVLGAVDIRLPFYVAGGLTLVNWCYGLFVLPESLKPEHRSPMRLSRMNPVGAYWSLAKYPLVLGMAIALFLLHMAQFALHATWALSMQYRFQWTPLHIGWSLAVVGLCAGFMQGRMTKPMIARFGERRTLLLALAMGVLSYIGYGAATSGWMIFAVIIVASIGAVGQPASQAMIANELPPSEQGSVQGALASVTSLAGIIGPLIGGYSLRFFIQDPPPIPNSPIPLAGGNFYVSALLAGLGCCAAAWAARHHVEKHSRKANGRSTTSA